MCPWGLVLKAAVPQGFRVRSETIYHLSPRVLAESQNWPTGRAADLLHYVSQHGPQRQSDLAQPLSSSPLGPLLRRLQTQGWLVAEQRRKRPAAGQRMVSRVQLRLSAADAEALQHQLQRRAPSQAAVLAYLKMHPDCELSALQTEVPSARAAVKRLAERQAVALTQVEQMRAVVSPAAFKPDVLPHLNQVQQHALRQIEVRLAAPDGVPILLHGVTGSGKTEVYMRAIATALQQDKTALVLVPEISLTAQAVERFAARFGSDIALLHSGLSTGERFDEWRRLLHGQARIAIGARSAVFAPLPQLGLIIIDEEHDTSYKQEETPRYNARDVAIVRAQQQQAVVVLGSATPALETFYHARNGKYLHLSMPQRIGDKPLPHITLVDQRAHNTPNERVISTPLHDAIDSRLKRHEQSLILINRRARSFGRTWDACGSGHACEGLARTTQGIR
jgi:primosomal protein N' (replication factor Y)